jgi:hypothetical protein
MGRRARLGIAIVLLVFASGCTASGPLVRASASPSAVASSTAAPSSAAPSLEPSASPTAKPTVASQPGASLTCYGTPTAASHPLVLVSNPNHDQVVLESLHDPAHATPLCVLGGGGYRFVSDTEIGFSTSSSPNDPIGGTTTIGRMSVTGGLPVVDAVVHGDVMDFAWSPDGASMAYLLYTLAPGLGSGDANQLWLKSGGGQPRALTPLIPLFGRGGSISDQISVRFSHDGKYLLMVDTYVDGPAPASAEYAHFQVRAMPAGNLVWVPPGALVQGDKIGFSFNTMAAWSRTSDRLYYRDAAGVHSWDPPATVGTLAAGLAWFLPSVSPDDRFVAYTVNPDTQPHLEVRDLFSGAVRVLPGVRAAPFFISSTTLLAGSYEPSVQQGLGILPFTQTGSVAIDLTTNVETRIPTLSAPIDYWPR